MDDLSSAYWRTPPIARYISTAVFATSILFHLGFIGGRWIFFHPSMLFKWWPEPWRLATNFLISSPQLGILLDPYFIYSYLSQMEVGFARFSRREDLIWYMAFIMTMVMVFAHYSGLQPYFHLQGFILAVAYTCTQDQRGQKANFFFVTIPAQLVPYSMMLVTLLVAGPAAMQLQLCGLVAAHLYDFLTRLWPEFGGGTNLLPTPALLSRLMSTPGRVTDHGFGQAIRPPGGNSAGGGRTTGGSSSSGGVLPDSWKSRGKGTRLGGD